MMVIFCKHTNTFIVTYEHMCVYWIFYNRFQLWKDVCLMLEADGLNLAQTCLTSCAVRK